MHGTGFADFVSASLDYLLKQRTYIANLRIYVAIMKCFSDMLDKCRCGHGKG